MSTTFLNVRFDPPHRRNATHQQGRPDQTRPDETRRNQTRADETRRDQAKPYQGRRLTREDARQTDRQADRQDRAGKGRTRQDRTGLDTSDAGSEFGNTASGKLLLLLLLLFFLLLLLPALVCRVSWLKSCSVPAGASSRDCCCGRTCVCSYLLRYFVRQLNPPGLGGQPSGG